MSTVPHSTAPHSADSGGHGTPPLPIAVLISGGGRTLRNLIQLSQSGKLPIDVRLVIASRPDAGGLAHAKAAQVPSRVVVREDWMSDNAYRDAVFEPCRQAGVSLVVMAGFMRHVLIPHDFLNRVVNIHPALIPSFCGHGYYGHLVHEAVLASGVKLSGCTVHYVDDEYDHGPIILQRSVPVEDDDTPDSLAARVFAAECQALPDALRLIAAGRLEVVEGRVRQR